MLLKWRSLQQGSITTPQVLVQEGQSVAVDDLMLFGNVQSLICFIGSGEALALTNAISIGRIVELATRETAVAAQFDLQQETGTLRFPEMSPMQGSV